MVIVGDYALYNSGPPTDRFQHWGIVLLYSFESQMPVWKPLPSTALLLLWRNFQRVRRSLQLASSLFLALIERAYSPPFLFFFCLTFSPDGDLESCGLPPRCRRPRPERLVVNRLKEKMRIISESKWYRARKNGWYVQPFTWVNSFVRGWVKFHPALA